MILYGLKQHNQYVGFGFVEDIQEATVYDPQVITVVELGTGEEQQCRTIVDYFTMEGTTSLTDFNIEDFTLTPDGQALFDIYTT